MLAIFTSCSQTADHHLSNETQRLGMKTINNQTVVLGFYYPSLDAPYRMSAVKMTATVVNDNTLITGTGFYKTLFAEKQKYGLKGPLPIVVYIADRQSNGVRIIEQLDDVEKLLSATHNMKIHLPFDPQKHSYEPLQFAALNLTHKNFSSILGREIRAIDIEPLNPLLSRGETYFTSSYMNSGATEKILITQQMDRSNLSFGVTETPEGAILHGQRSDPAFKANPNVAQGGPIFYIDPEFNKPVLVGIDNQRMHVAIMQDLKFLEKSELKLNLRTDFFAASCLARGPK